MRTTARYWLAGSAIVVQLLVSGCQLGGGGGLLGLFGSGESAELAGILGSGGSPSSVGDGSGLQNLLLPGSITDNDNVNTDSSGISSHLLSDTTTTDENSTEDTQLTHPIASVHHPEPASLALFGGGLAGFSLFRRKKAR